MLGCGLLAFELCFEAGCTNVSAIQGEFRRSRGSTMIGTIS